MLICNIPLGISSRAARGRLPTVTHVSLQEHRHAERCPEAAEVFQLVGTCAGLVEAFCLASACVGKRQLAGGVVRPRGHAGLERVAKVDRILLRRSMGRDKYTLDQQAIAQEGSDCQELHVRLDLPSIPQHDALEVTQKFCCAEARRDTRANAALESPKARTRCDLARPSSVRSKWPPDPSARPR
jgi:hypothetical protein